MQEFKFVQIMIPGGGVGPQRAEYILHINIQRKSSKIFFSKTNMPDMLKFVQKHPQLVQVQDCSNDVPRGREGIQWRGQILQRNIKIIFSKTIWQGKLKFVQKHLRALQIQVCLNHVPQEQVEATMGGRVYRGIYRENL